MILPGRDIGEGHVYAYMGNRLGVECVSASRQIETADDPPPLLHLSTADLYRTPGDKLYDRHRK